MKQFFGRKRSVVLALFGVLAIAGGAIAYWTTTGTGTGTATTGSSAAVTVLQDAAITGLAPNSGSQNVTFKIKNDATQNQYVMSVTASIASVVPGTKGDKICAASDFTLSAGPVAVGQDVAKSSTFTPTGLAWQTLSFNNKPTNQDGCQGATVNLSFSSN